MKKLFILLFLAACLPHFLSAQRNFAPLGAEWRFVAGGIEDSPCDRHVWLKVESEITIAGKNCGVIRKYSKLFQQANFTLAPDSLVVWEEGGRVYFFDTAPFGTGQFYLLYDFNLTAGDTLEFYLPHNAAAFGLRNELDEFHLAVQGPLHNLVTSSSLVEVSGEMLRRIDTEPLEGSDPMNCRALGTILERIGCNSHGLAGSICIIQLDNCDGYFVCYQDDDLLLGGNDEMVCDFPTAVAWQEENGGLLVFPNPASGEVRLELPSPLSVPSRWVLYNALGQQVAVQAIGAGTAVTEIVHLEGLPPGLYFWEFTMSGSQVTTGGKLVISK